MTPNLRVALCAALFQATSAVAVEPHSNTGAASEPKESLQHRAYEGKVYDGLPLYPTTRCGTAAGTTRDIEACLARVLDVAEAEQTRVLQVLLAFLESAERHGLLEREEEHRRVLKKDCDAQYERYLQGSIRGIAYASCIVCGTRLRTRALEQLLDWTAMERAKQRKEERVRWKALQLPLCDE